MPDDVVIAVGDEIKPAQHTLGGFLSGVAGFVLLGAVALIAAHRFVRLPDADLEMAVPHSPVVQFDNAQGPVSSARSDAIMAQLERNDDDSALLQKHLAYEQAINADSPLVLGNKLTLLQNGPATYASMFAAIRAATDHINLETYIFDDDAIGTQFAELLIERQAAGVQVNIVYDSVGTMTTPQAFFDRLQAAGIQLLEFNPLNPLDGNKDEWMINSRDHRRQLIIDGRIAFTGGINISSTYSSAPSGRYPGKLHDPAPDAGNGWRDTHIRIEGPVVAQFQKLFMDTWMRQRGLPMQVRRYFPELKTEGSEIVRAIGSTPDDPHSLIYLTLISAISHAEHSVHLTIAYFAPDPQLLAALTEAAQRGVEVTLVLPSYSDSWTVFHLGRSYYEPLLRAGVHVYERQGAVMHAKTACIDGVWSTVGSTNLDWRSFLHNDEINAVVLGHGFATQMEKMFADDVGKSQAITLDAWRQRSVVMRAKERMARNFAYWL